MCKKKGIYCEGYKYWRKLKYEKDKYDCYLRKKPAYWDLRKFK